MKRSTERILTTHAGSLPRPPDLTRMMWDLIDGKPVDEAGLRARIREAVAEVVRKQRDAGVDVVSDGEMSKVGFSNYVMQRYSGFANRAQFVATDLGEFPDIVNKLFVENEGGRHALMPPWRVSEIAKYVTVGVSGLHNPCGAIMNQQSYASLTPSQKTAFDKLTGKTLALKASKIFDDWEQAAFKLARDSNRIELIQLSPEVRKTLFDAAQPALEKVLTEFEKGGVPDIRAAYAAMNK